MDRTAALTAIPRWIAARGKWSRLGLAVLAGAVMTAGQAPLSQHWAMFVAMPVLVWLLDGSTVRGAALVGWGAAFGYFVTGLYWIGYAFLVDAAEFAWMMPFAVTLLPAFLGLFWAAAFALARRVWPGDTPFRVLALAASLTLFEFARGHVLTGFPWGLAAYVWADTPILQAGAWAGPYALTFLTLALTPLPLMGLMGGGRLAGLAAMVALAGLWVAGEQRLSLNDVGEGDGVVLRLVQPDAEQKLKWDPEHAQLFYKRLLDGTAAPAGPLGPPAAVIWPETSVNFLPAYKPERRAEIAEAANGVPVLMGALHARLWDGQEQWLNSILPIMPDATMGPRYDKFHLVPFGEYLPYPAILGPIGFRQLVKQGGFTAGEGPRIMTVPGLPPFSALICYEMIFPEQVVPMGQRPAWILQVTNDAWFGDWGGPQQHLAQAQARAIEQGLPVVRVANTGISAVIDALGRIRASLPMHANGHIDARLPAALPPTFYAQHGDTPGMIGVIVVFVIFSRLAARRRQSAREDDTQRG